MTDCPASSQSRFIDAIVLVRYQIFIDFVPGSILQNFVHVGQFFPNGSLNTLVVGIIFVLYHITKVAVW